MTVRSLVRGVIVSLAVAAALAVAEIALEVREATRGPRWEEWPPYVRQGHDD